jgi:hypothetical protein
LGVHGRTLHWVWTLSGHAGKSWKALSAAVKSLPADLINVNTGKVAMRRAVSGCR